MIAVSVGELKKGDTMKTVEKLLEEGRKILKMKEDLAQAERQREAAKVEKIWLLLREKVHELNIPICLPLSPPDDFADDARRGKTTLGWRPFGAVPIEMTFFFRDFDKVWVFDDFFVVQMDWRVEEVDVGKWEWMIICRQRQSIKSLPEAVAVCESLTAKYREAQAQLQTMLEGSNEPKLEGRGA